MRKIKFEYWGWMMPRAQFSLVEKDDRRVVSLDDYSLFDNHLDTITDEQFNALWKDFKSIKSKKLEKENNSHRIICDGFSITMTVSNGRRQRVTYISNPDEEYFRDYHLEECIKWLELYKKLFQLLEENGAHICEDMDLRNTKSQKTASFKIEEESYGTEEGFIEIYRDYL